LKTLGFTDAAMLWSVFAEAAALCLMGAIAGMSLAAAALAALSSSLQLPFRPGDPSLWLQALACALVMAFLVGILPALRAQRLKIVDALAGR
jgi:putative ABC transport system permease protein